MAESVSMKYSGPEGIAFDSVSPYNEGSRYPTPGEVYSVDPDTANSLNIYEGWNEEGEKSVADKIAEQRESLEDNEAGAVRGDKESMEAFNQNAVASEDESDEDSE